MSESRLLIHAFHFSNCLPGRVKLVVITASRQQSEGKCANKKCIIRRVEVEYLNEDNIDRARTAT
jgi:hypothetical protein